MKWIALSLIRESSNEKIYFYVCVRQRDIFDVE